MVLVLSTAVLYSVYIYRTESRTVGVVLVLWAAVLFSCLPLLPAHGIKSNVSELLYTSHSQSLDKLVSPIT
jgi:hypothetical protein